MSNLKKAKIVLFFINILMISISNAQNIRDYSGQWCWDKDNEISAFSVVIHKVSNIYKGSYSSVTQSGNKIDDNDHAFSFKVTRNKLIQTRIISGVTGNEGIIQLKIVNNLKLEWLVIQRPKGEFYVPLKAILHRCKAI